MTTWNHRVWKYTYTHNDGTSEDVYSIRETYYTSNGEICSCTNEPLKLEETSLEDLQTTIQRCLNSLTSPVLDLNTFKFASWGYENDKVVGKPCSSAEELFKDMGIK